MATRSDSAIPGLFVLAVVVGVVTVGLLLKPPAAFELGPGQPESLATPASSSAVEWVWVGAVSPDRATVVAKVADDAVDVDLVVQAAGEDALRLSADIGSDHLRFRLSDLQPQTRYQYRLEVDGRAEPGGEFETFPVGARSLLVTAGSCARVGSNGAVFDAIAALGPDLHLMLGDAHYEDIADNDTERFLAAFDRLLTQPGQAALYRSVPVAYVWDDHDYGANNSDAASASRPAARSAYQTAVPHYPLVAGQGDVPIYQAFTAGRVRFVLTDNRSSRSDSSMLGEQQLDWLIRELINSSATHALVVWANPSPWIGVRDDGADTWAGFANERAVIADAIAAAKIDNLVMVSGDAHMVAIDDGTNSDYSTEGVGGFPLLHAAALDQDGSVKGGPYSEGAYPGGGQFGVLEIMDDGGDVLAVRMSGRNWTGHEIVSLELTFPVDRSR